MNDIKQELRSGGNVTHVLNILVSRQKSEDEEKTILQEIYKIIANKEILKDIDGFQVPITWRTSTKTSPHYHANVQLFTDTVVKQHTKKLRQDIFTQLDPQLTTGLDIQVTKHLSKPSTLDFV